MKPLTAIATVFLLVSTVQACAQAPAKATSRAGDYVWYDGGKAREVHPLMWIVAALFVVYFAYTPISGWLS